MDLFRIMEDAESESLHFMQINMWVWRQDCWQAGFPQQAGSVLCDAGTGHQHSRRAKFPQKSLQSYREHCTPALLPQHFLAFTDICYFPLSFHSIDIALTVMGCRPHMKILRLYLGHLKEEPFWTYCMEKKDLRTSIAVTCSFVFLELKTSWWKD